MKATFGRTMVVFSTISGLHLGLIFWYTMTIDPYFWCNKHRLGKSNLSHPWICDSSIIGNFPKDIIGRLMMMQSHCTSWVNSPTQDSSHHQDYYIFVGLVKSRTKSSFVTSIPGWGGVDPCRSMVHSVQKITNISPKCRYIPMPLNVPWIPSFFGPKFRLAKQNPPPYMGVSSKIWVPQIGWFIMENPIKLDDLGGKPTIFGNPPYRWRSIISSYPNPIQLPPIIRPRSIRHFRRWSGAFEHLTFGLFNGSFFLHMGKHLEGAEKNDQKR